MRTSRSVAAKSPTDEVPDSAAAASSATPITTPTGIPNDKGSRTTAIHTAAPPPSSVAPCGCNATDATPAAPISEITAVCITYRRSVNPPLIAIAGAPANASSASVTPSPLPWIAGWGCAPIAPATTTRTTAQPIGRKVSRWRRTRSAACSRASAIRGLSLADVTGTLVTVLPSDAHSFDTDDRTPPAHIWDPEAFQCWVGGQTAAPTATVVLAGAAWRARPLRYTVTTRTGTSQIAIETRATGQAAALI